ncbi:MAG: glycoside hydrolase family 2 protein [Acidobacteria bacterium]|nr:glycoside hydrolase family 2 protein [Acidobacteriota bacterium]
MNHRPRAISRRTFVGTSALGRLAPLALGSLLRTGTAAADTPGGPARYRLPLDGDWLFGGKLSGDALKRGFDDRAFATVELPHCVAKLSWQDWDPAAWHEVWAYRRHFSTPAAFAGRRVFLEFDGVMVGASPVLNDRALPGHLGGYLPFRYEITGMLSGGDNVLAVAVDSRWMNVPPEGSPKGPPSIDYLEPGGILRGVRLFAVPQVFLSDVFAKPVKVLDAARRIEVSCTLDAAPQAAGRNVRVRTELRSGARTLARVEQAVKLEQSGPTPVSLTLSNLGNVALWSPDAPHLYDVVTTLIVDREPVHDYAVRTGLREARFDVDGFFLNGSRFRLFGLNRHELYPYVGAAMPRRAMRRDAEILRRDFHCNTVRCSHYPQSEAFLDACDELGLMVWEEPPGWQYIGDDAWKELAVRDVREMILRDRNHPSVIIWGVRINESPNDPPLYRRTREAAHALDDSRPTSGSMTAASTQGWSQDVFAFDDYHAAPDHTVGIHPPLPGVPFMFAETVGQYNYATGRGFGARYRRAADVPLQVAQAIRHAQAHDRAAAFARCAGVIAWCAFDYGSLMNSYRGVKCPGVADVFRIPKLGASFYQGQGDPKVRPAIVPNFYWEFGPATPRGPGKGAAIFSNCERLELFVDGRRLAELHPDRAGYPNLEHPPFFCDLDLDGAGNPELRIDGYAGGKLVISKLLSSDHAHDRLILGADDAAIAAGGSDATRVFFHAADRYGAVRPFAGGDVTLAISGPGAIVGDTVLHLADTGGVGAVWVRGLPRKTGEIVITAAHSSLGQKSVRIRVTAA